MSLSPSSCRGLLAWGAAAGVMLLVGLVPFRSAEEVHGQTSKDAASQAAEADPPTNSAELRQQRIVDLRQEVELAVRQLEAGDAVGFIEDYYPVDGLRSLRSQSSVSEAARGPTFSRENLTQLAVLLKLCAKTQPTLGKDQGIAVFTVTLPVKKLPPPESEQKVVPTSEKLPGLGPDLGAALDAAAKLIKEKKWEDFILRFYPVPEARRLQATGELEDLLYVISENPSMGEAMARDVTAMQQAKPTLGENNTVAEYRIPGKRAKDPAQVWRLQLSEGHWRLFDWTTKSRKVIKEVVTGTWQGPADTVDIQWERIGKRWRLAERDLFD